MYKNILSVIIAIYMFLGGCTMIPKYTQPKAPVPGKWPQEGIYKKAEIRAGAPVATKLSWQKFFIDARLLKLIEMALANNRDLRLAALNVEHARALYGVRRAELFPSLTAAGSGSKQRVPADLSVTGNSMIEKQYSVNLGITSWEIDFFGRIRSLEEKALQEYLATEQARRSAQISLISEVGRAYFTLAADRQNLKLSEDILKSREAMYSLISRQYEVGVVNELDLRRVQTQVDTARGAVARYTQLVAQDENALNLLVGSTVPRELLPSNMDSVKPPEEISAGLSSSVLLRRPDIIAAEHRLKAAYANIGAARSALFPRIALTTSAGTASSELSGLFEAGSRTWNFTPQISVPIFDARTWAALRVTKTERKIALAQYEKAIQTAFKEVSDSLAVKGTIEQRIEAQQSLVDALARTYQLSKERYTKGIDSYLGVLDAQRSLYAAQQGLISLRLAKLANQIRLYAVLGGGAR